MAPAFRFNTLLGVSAVLSSIFTSCITTSLQSLTIDGPVIQPPLHLSDSASIRSVRIQPWVSMRTVDTRIGRIEGHTLVNAQGFYQVDTVTSGGRTTYQETKGVNVYPYGGRNFRWNLPQAAGGVDLDLNGGGSFNLGLGGSLAFSGGSSFWQAHVGIGLDFQGRATGARLDGGISWQQTSYDLFVVQTLDIFVSNTKAVNFAAANGKDTRTSYYLSLMINGKSESSPLALFLQSAVVVQTLVRSDFLLNTSSAFPGQSRSMTLLSLTPGLALRLSPTTRIIAGVRLISDSGLDATNSTFIIFPTAQLEITL